jgi:hypothetical protein
MEAAQSKKSGNSNGDEESKESESVDATRYYSVKEVAQHNVYNDW